MTLILRKLSAGVSRCSFSTLVKLLSNSASRAYKVRLNSAVCCPRKSSLLSPLKSHGRFHCNDSIPPTKVTPGWLMATFWLFQFFGNSKHEEVKKMMHKAKKVLENGDIDEATKLYKEALHLAVATNDVDHEFDIKQKLGIIHFASEKYQDAEKLLSEVKDYLLKNKKIHSVKLSYVLLRLAEIYQFTNNFEKAEQHYNACADNLKMKIDDALKENDEEIIEFWLMFLESEAHYYLMRGVFEKAQKYFQRAYEISLKTKGELSEHTVTFLQQLGAVAFQNGDLELAVEYLKQAADSGKHLPGMEKLSNVYVSLGNIYLKQGLLKDAEVMCHQAYKNAKRHNYEKGIQDSNACLKELQDALSSS